MKNVFLLCFLIIPLEIFCCSFVAIPFCKTIIDYQENVIVYGTIISKDVDGLDLQVIEVLRGDENRAQIRIWDGQDFDCNGPHDMSVNTIGQVNDTIIITIPRIDSLVNTWDVIGDYSTPFPYGENPTLHVKEGFTTGFITENANIENVYAQTFSYAELSTALKTFGDCTDLVFTSSESEIAPKNKIEVQNPVSSSLSILQSQSAEIDEVNIYSISGEKLITQRTEDQLQIMLSVDHLPANMYIVQLIKSDNTQEFIKLVKM